MKKQITFGIFLVFLLIATVPAQVILEENFDNGASDDPDITVVNTDWTRHSGAQGPTYSAAGLTFTGYTGSGIGGALAFTNGGSGTNDGDVNRGASDSITTTAYVSFLVELSSGLAGDYFFHLGAKNMGFNYRLRIYAKDTTAGGWKIGISKSSGGQLYSDTVLSYNQTYLVIAKYVINTASATDDEIMLYIYDGAVPLSEPGSPLISFGPIGAGVSGDIDDIGTVAIRQGSNTPTGKIDGIMLSSSWPTTPTVITIAEAIEDLNMDFVPDHKVLGDTVTVTGVITSPNFQTSHNSFYLQDGTAGTDIFNYFSDVNIKFDWALGDSLIITGVVDQYNGTTEIIPLDSLSWNFVGTGTVPDPIEITLAEYQANPEMYEGSLILIKGLTLVSGTWPASSSANLSLSDGVDTVVFRVDSDTDIPGNTEPTWPQDVVGIGSQFDSGTPPDGGYQIFPRYYTDFTPSVIVPVELTSFTAKVTDNAVNLIWSTATETNNRGFEVERKTTDKFVTIGFIEGNGTSTETNSYSFADTKVEAGTYSYRLKQVDFDGSYEYSPVVEAEILHPVSFSLDQNYPNPFNPNTMINVNLAADSKVKLIVYDILGQEVSTLVNGNLAAGSHQFEFNASNLNSGVYFYRIDAAGIDGTSFSSVKKMILTK